MLTRKSKGAALSMASANGKHSFLGTDEPKADQIHSGRLTRVKTAKVSRSIKPKRLSQSISIG